MSDLNINLDRDTLDDAIAGAILGHISQDDQKQALQNAITYLLRDGSYTTTVLQRSIHTAVNQVMTEWAVEYIKSKPEFRKMFDKIAATMLRDLLNKNGQARNIIARSLVSEIGSALDDE